MKFGMSELFKKLRDERHKLYDALLTKILGFPKVQEYIEELKKDEEWNREHKWGEYEFEQNAVENFFEFGDEEILRVEEIWSKVKEAIRSKAEEDITSDPKELVQHGYIRVDSIVNDVLEEISEELTEALKRKHDRVKKQN